MPLAKAGVYAGGGNIKSSAFVFCLTVTLLNAEDSEHDMAIFKVFECRN